MLNRKPTQRPTFWTGTEVPPGEPYLDIIESEIEGSAHDYVATFKFAGDVPSQTSSSDLFLEWDIMVDIDENNTTGAWSDDINKASRQIMVNGIGVNLMVRMAMSGTQTWAEWYLVRDQTWGIVSSSVSGNQITLNGSNSNEIALETPGEL